MEATKTNAFAQCGGCAGNDFARLAAQAEISAIQSATGNAGREDWAEVMRICRVTAVKEVWELGLNLAVKARAWSVVFDAGIRGGEGAGICACELAAACRKWEILGMIAERASPPVSRHALSMFSGATADDAEDVLANGTPGAAKRFALYAGDDACIRLVDAASTRGMWGIVGEVVFGRRDEAVLYALKACAGNGRWNIVHRAALYCGEEQVIASAVGLARSAKKWELLRDLCVFGSENVSRASCDAAFAERKLGAVFEASENAVSAGARSYAESLLSGCGFADADAMFHFRDWRGMLAICCGGSEEVAKYAVEKMAGAREWVALCDVVRFAPGGVSDFAREKIAGVNSRDLIKLAANREYAAVEDFAFYAPSGIREQAVDVLAGRGDWKRLGRIVLLADAETSRHARERFSGTKVSDVSAAVKKRDWEEVQVLGCFGDDAVSRHACINSAAAAQDAVLEEIMATAGGERAEFARGQLSFNREKAEAAYPSQNYSLAERCDVEDLVVMRMWDAIEYVARFADGDAGMAAVDALMHERMWGALARIAKRAEEDERGEYAKKQFSFARREDVRLASSARDIWALEAMSELAPMPVAVYAKAQLARHVKTPHGAGTNLSVPHFGAEKGIALAVACARKSNCF